MSELTDNKKVDQAGAEGDGEKNTKTHDDDQGTGENVGFSEGKSSTETFSAEYVKTLREENKKNRIKAKDAEKTALEAKAALDEINQKSAENFNKLHKTFEKRLINAELHKIAMKEGLIDMDAFKMADLSSVKLSENGEIEGLEAAINELKSTKPYLFKLSSNSNKDAKDPAADLASKQKATYETSQAFEKAKEEFFRSLRKVN